MIFLDIECYSNFFYIGMENRRGARKSITAPLNLEDREFLIEMLTNQKIVTYNGCNYDIPLLHAALMYNGTVGFLYDLSKEIIESKDPTWKVMKKHGIYVKDPPGHYDLFRHMPMMLSLKTYAGRIGAPRLRNLPYEPKTELTEKEKKVVAEYCMNDIELLKYLWEEIKSTVEMKQGESKNLRFRATNLTDSQIGEKVFRSRLKRPVPGKFKKVPYIAPKWAKFKNESFRNVRDAMESAVYRMNTKGSIILPPTLNDKKPKIQDLELRIGIGGLHSREKAVELRSTKKTKIALVDAASYYPNLIKTLQIEPLGFDGAMLRYYENFIDQRIEAKGKGQEETSKIFKIVLNSVFGKFLNKYSMLYSPYDGINVTLSGQLGMMLLADLLFEAGADIQSINTDGVLFTYHLRHRGHIRKALTEWKERTSIDLDGTNIVNAWLKDVNSYLFELPDGKTKGKGVYAESSLSKTPQGEVHVDAAKAYLMHGAPIRETIENEIDIRKFMHVRNVTGGGVWRKTGKNIGKVVRWGWQEGGDIITYANNGNKVPKTDNAYPVMDMTKSDFRPLIEMYEDDAINLVQISGGQIA